MAGAALRRGLDVWRRGHAALPLIAGILFFAGGTKAATTNEVLDAENRGRNLAQQLLQQWPATNVTQTGVLKIRDAKKQTTVIPVKCEVRVTATNWSSLYEATFTNRIETLAVIHAAGQPNQYFYGSHFSNDVPLVQGHELTGAEAAVSFAGSDFWLADLGLEFFHWPAQKILRHEFRRTLGCNVLESANPNPSTNGYSRVLTWIDSESGGIVQAEAYDAKGKRFKEFFPKDMKKVNGQWQVEEMEIDNDRTDSRTRLEFDLKKK
jgi:hypothetical protein